MSIASAGSLQDLVGFLSDTHAAGVDLFLHQQGIDTTSIYKDHGISGAKGKDKRPQFDALHKAAVRREFDVGMAWSVAPGGKAMFQMLGVFAEFERSIIQERVRAGLRRAKAEGKQLGRPRIAPELEAKIVAALKAPGRTEGVRKIAKRFGVDPGTVQRISSLSRP